MVRTQRELES
jgi:hypothetical protein